MWPPYCPFLEEIAILEVIEACKWWSSEAGWFVFAAVAVGDTSRVHSSFVFQACQTTWRGYVQGIGMQGSSSGGG